MKQNMEQDRLGCARCFEILDECSSSSTSNLFIDLCEVVLPRSEDLPSIEMEKFFKKFFLNAKEKDIDRFFAFCYFYGVRPRMLFARLMKLIPLNEMRIIFPRLSKSARNIITREASGDDLSKLCPGIMKSWLC